MAYPRTIMLSAALALSVAMPAAAQDTKHVKWNDDGTVELSMDPEYGGVIKTTREELGALFGPGEKPSADAARRRLSPGSPRAPGRARRWRSDP